MKLVPHGATSSSGQHEHYLVVLNSELSNGTLGFRCWPQQTTLDWHWWVNHGAGRTWVS